MFQIERVALWWKSEEEGIKVPSHPINQYRTDFKSSVIIIFGLA